MRQGFNRQSGPYTEYEFEGCEENIRGLAQDMEAQGCSEWQIDHDGCRYMLKARFADDQSGDPETPLDEVRLHANRAAVSIYNGPGFRQVAPEDVQKIRRQQQNPNPDFTPAVLGGNGAELLYYLLQDGQEHYTVSQPVLVRSRAASSSYDFSAYTNAAYQNVGYIIDTSHIAADAALPSPLLFTLPGTTTIEEDDRGISYAYGWLKHYPEYTQAAGNKAVLTQEWEFGRWAVWGYVGSGVLRLLADYAGF